MNRYGSGFHDSGFRDTLLSYIRDGGLVLGVSAGSLIFANAGGHENGRALCRKQPGGQGVLPAAEEYPFVQYRRYADPKHPVGHGDH